MNSIIHDSLKHGRNFQIGHFCIIEEDVIIGNNVKIDNYVLLKKGTRIGNNVWIDSYVRSSGYNKIGNYIDLRFGCTIARNVTICDGVYVSPNVMTIYKKHTREVTEGIVIGKNSFIGTAAVIGANVIIGENVIIGANAYVSRNCLEPGIYIGTPAVLKERGKD